METPTNSTRPLPVAVGMAVLGTIVLLLGLVWDARLHAADRDLAASEGVFSLTNPGHLLAAVGLVLVAAGVIAASGILWLGRLSAVARAAGVVLLAVGALGAGGVAVISTSADAEHGHDGEPGGAHEQSRRHHQLRDYEALWEAATPEERAAATRLVADTRAATLRYADFDDTQRAGYRPNRRGGDEATHHPDPSLIHDGQVLDPNAPESLMYWSAPDGRKVLVGVVYKAAPWEQAPAPGGDLTAWHTHAGANKCYVGVEPDCPENTTKMLHVFFFDGVKDPFTDSMVAAAGGREAFARAMSH